MTTTIAPSTDSTAAREARVLLVDDDRELCLMLCEYLAAEHFEVKSVHDGSDALAELQAGEFEIVILDVMLPNVGGFDVLRKLGASYPVPILMLTARGDDVDRIVGPGAGRGRLLEQTLQSARIGGAHSRDSAPRQSQRGARRICLTNWPWGPSP